MDREENELSQSPLLVLVAMIASFGGMYALLKKEPFIGSLSCFVLSICTVLAGVQKLRTGKLLFRTKTEGRGRRTVIVHRSSRPILFFSMIFIQFAVAVGLAAVGLYLWKDMLFN